MDKKEQAVIFVDLPAALCLTLKISRVGTLSGSFYPLTAIAAFVFCVIGLLGAKSKTRWIFINAAAMALVVLFGQWCNKVFGNNNISAFLHGAMLYYGLMAFSTPIVYYFSPPAAKNDNPKN